MNSNSVSSGVEGHAPSPTGGEDYQPAAWTAAGYERRAEATQIAVAGIKPRLDVEPYRKLTLRQHAVVILDSAGLQNKQIARMLGCSLGTVSTTKHAAWRVLGVTGRDHRAAALRTQRIADASTATGSGDDLPILADPAAVFSPGALLPGIQAAADSADHAYSPEDSGQPHGQSQDSPAGYDRSTGDSDFCGQRAT